MELKTFIIQTLSPSQKVEIMNHYCQERYACGNNNEREDYECPLYKNPNLDCPHGLSEEERIQAVDELISDYRITTDDIERWFDDKDEFFEFRKALNDFKDRQDKIDVEVTNVDMINHPPHYNHGMESIKEMELIFGKEAVLHFCALNAWKYRKRAMYKGGEEDMKKADWYIDYYDRLMKGRAHDGE